MKRLLKIILISFSLLFLTVNTSCRKKPQPQPEPTAEVTPSPTPTPSSTPTASPEETEEPPAAYSVEEDGEYDTKDEVAEYIWIFHHLPSNYMTKKEARQKGWESGALHLVVEGKCIGGDVFSNREGYLPKKRGVKYYECDIDTLHRKSRGKKRIVYSTEWNIYYTDDHYDTFELLYGEE